ncbi:MAG: hypothetical protein QME88_10690 [Actinomycetota bacterium]|nr:hypothetical protein [Actinomycetota bacterium]
MKDADRMVDQMQGVVAGLMRCQLVEAVLQEPSCRLEMRLLPGDPSPLGQDRESRHGLRADGERPLPSSRGESRRCLLLRSPAVGTWCPPDQGNVPGVENRAPSAGTVHTLLGDEEVIPSRRGRLLLELAERHSLVGFGTPLALWEVT